jgi:N-methylhydantoinase A
MRRVGVDTGGTFTDSVLWDEDKGLIASAKVSSNKSDPSSAVIASVDKLGSEETVDVRYLIHGTTVATNATIERAGPRIGMICTVGFRDVLEIARLTRPPEQIYDLRANPPAPLVQRRDRLEINERIDHRGEVIGPLEESSVVEAARTLSRRGINCVAVCLMHSYLNNTHERMVRDILEREMPGALISISSEVLPEFREYERSSTTALNAYLAPIVGDYLRQLQDSVTAWNKQTRLWVMQSNGGVASAERTAEVPVTLLLSGPSGGVVAGRHLIEETGLENGITIDMGGTSFDVCLLPSQGIPMTQERHVMDMPIRVSSVDILTIGAGGGSIGWVDAAGQFRVGPKSAGATPGPACYNLGGDEPTVTDANLVLGVLGPEQRLGGEVALNPDLAHKACEKLGRRLGMDAREVAWGIRRIVNATMAGATRTVSVGRGHDPRDFSLIAFGGAGPMHAIDIATELEIPKVLVPATPGCLSAFGLVVSDVTHDYVMTHLAPIDATLHLQLERIFAELTAGAHAQLAEEGIEEKRRDLFRILDLRYIGEQSSISVPVAANGADWLTATTQEFHSTHEQLYGFCVLDEPVEVVNVRLRAVGRLYRPPRNGIAKLPSLPRQPKRIGTRLVAFGPNKSDYIETPVYERTTLVAGMSFVGPAIVEQNDSTLIVPRKRIVRADDHSNLLIQAGDS